MLRDANYRAIFILRGVVPVHASVVRGLLWVWAESKVRRDSEEMVDVPPRGSSYPELCLVHPPTQLLGPTREIAYTQD